MQELERKEIEMELEDRRRMEIKKNLINDAAKKQDEPVDDSKLVEAMFDFLPDSSSEAPTPARETSVFNVSRNNLIFRLIKSQKSFRIGIIIFSLFNIKVRKLYLFLSYLKKEIKKILISFFSDRIFRHQKPINIRR